MPSTFNSASLFASGPSRFHVGPAGSQVIQNTTIDSVTPGRQVIGPIGQTITIRGRLVGASDAELWSLIDAILTQLTTPPTVADLTDPSGRIFADMSFTTFRTLAPFDHARTVSVPYEATFERFA